MRLGSFIKALFSSYFVTGLLSLVMKFVFSMDITNYGPELFQGAYDINLMMILFWPVYVLQTIRSYGFTLLVILLVVFFLVTLFAVYESLMSRYRRRYEN